MNIHTVMVTYNRLELTKQAIQSWRETTYGPATLFVVDNASEDGTTEWLDENLSSWNRLFLPKNMYPGYATNRGWEYAPSDTVLLHRADNDFVFLPDWETHVRLQFSVNERLGQLGLRTDEEELFNAHNVGGNCVIRKQLWDEGLRYDERTWPEISAKVRGYTEDSFLSPRVRKMGWEWGRVTQPCIVDIAGNEGSYDGKYDDYLKQTKLDRGIG